MSQDLAAALEAARRGLLDLSTRNRLLALPAPGRSRGVIWLDGEDAGFALETLGAGRARLLAAHREGGLPDELLAALENEQDLEELRIRRLLGAPEPAR